MHPVVCGIGNFTIYSYGLMLAIAFLISSNLVVSCARRENIDVEMIFGFCFMVFISGVIGARILYVVENAAYYLKNPIEMIMLAHGGLSWFGGLILSVICGMVYLSRKGLPIYRVLDLISPFVALGQAIGRIGCLLNGCCYGKVSSFGIYFKSQEATLIPTQLYSSLALIFIFIILRALQDRPHKQGEIFFMYLLLYSIKRFFIEFWRADNEIIWFGLTLFQFISILIFCLAVFKLVSIKKSHD
jgi:phosphatidylglycerol---prolipoprotein diacylglyceryl transferase